MNALLCFCIDYAVICVVALNVFVLVCTVVFPDMFDCWFGCVFLLCVEFVSTCFTGFIVFLCACIVLN